MPKMGYTSNMHRKLKRIFVLIVGVILLILGIFGLVLPILQGVIFLVVGFLLISLCFPKVRLLITKYTERHKSTSVSATISKMEKWLTKFIGEI